MAATGAPNKLNILAGTGRPSLAYFADAPDPADLADLLPTAVDGELDADFHDFGWVSTDGLTAARAISTTDVPAYGTRSPVRTFITADTRTFQLTALESNPTVLAVYNQIAIADVDVAGDGSFAIISGAAEELPEYCAVFDVVDSGRGVVRYVVPNCQVTATGDRQAQGGAVLSYNMTVTCYPIMVGDTLISVAEYYKVDALATETPSGVARRSRRKAAAKAEG